MGLVKSLLLKLVKHLDEPRVIYDRDGGSPYLSRWYLLRDRPPEDDKLRGQSGEYDEDGKPKSEDRLFDLFLHRFHRSDDDEALHNHPWEWAVAMVLSGGYAEERRDGDRVVLRVIRPVSLNLIRGDDYHRVELLEDDAWSLFLVGRKVSTWHFWDRYKKARMQWRKFIEVKRGEADHEWEPDRREVSDVGA